MQGYLVGPNATLENANLIGANLENTGGVTWSHTTCPDATNSDNHGNTCAGHL